MIWQNLLSCSLFHEVDPLGEIIIIWLRFHKKGNTIYFNNLTLVAGTKDTYISCPLKCFCEFQVPRILKSKNTRTRKITRKKICRTLCINNCWFKHKVPAASDVGRLHDWAPEYCRDEFDESFKQVLISRLNLWCNLLPNLQSTFILH